MSENYELALALHVRDRLAKFTPHGEKFHYASEATIREALDDLGLKLVPQNPALDAWLAQYERRKQDK